MYCVILLLYPPREPGGTLSLSANTYAGHSLRTCRKRVEQFLAPRPPRVPGRACPPVGASSYRWARARPTISDARAREENGRVLAGRPTRWYTAEDASWQNETKRKLTVKRHTPGLVPVCKGVKYHVYTYPLIHFKSA